MKQNRVLVKLVITAYFLAAVILGLGNPDWFPEFYRPHLMASLALVSIFIIFLPRMIFKHSDNKTRTKALDELEGVTAISLFLNGLGGLGLYKLYLVGFPYDKLVHFLVSFIFIVVLSRFIEIWYKKSTNQSLLIAAALVIMAGLGWEVIEAVSDKVLNTQLLGGGSSRIFEDTLWDVAMGLTGVILGVGTVLLQNHKVVVPKVVELVEKEEKTA